MATASAEKEIIGNLLTSMDSGDIRKMFGAAEKAAGIAPVFLKRESFARTSVSTGSLCIDRILGGGIPPGRIIGIAGPERAGKSLITTQIMANQLSNGRFGVYFDAEGATDPLFLKARGIDFDKYRGRRTKGGNLGKDEADQIYFYQPTTGEEVLKYIHSLSGALPENRNPDAPPTIYALDSVVALISDALEEDLDSNKMAMHARMYAQMLPIINGNLVRSGCSFIYTNQIRQKTMSNGYGCIQGDSPVQFVDGRVHSMQEVVEGKIEGEVWTFIDGEIVPSKITNWFNNGPSESEDWMVITTEGPGSGNGTYSVAATKKHKFLTSNGDWVEAQELKVGDELITKYEEVVASEKLPAEFHGKDKEFDLAPSTKMRPLPVKVTKVKEGLSHQSTTKYDIEVENGHNYLVGHKRGGLIVHNSPDYEPCGDALKFFSSIRLKLSQSKPKLGDADHPFLQKEFSGALPKQGGVWEEPHYDASLKQIGMDRYIYTAVRTEKNKVYNPYKTTWMRIQFEQDGSTGQGLDPVFDTFTFLSELGFIRPAIPRDGEKVGEVRYLYETVSSEHFNPAIFGIAERFSYPQYKAWVQMNPGFSQVLRERYILTGIAFD